MTISSSAYAPTDAVYAALDLGTNNCRMLAARPLTGGGFRVVDAFSRITRLGEGLASSGRLSQAAMDRTIAALQVCVDKMRRNRVTRARLVATEACRRAENCAEFADRVLDETGLVLDIISAQDEAAFALGGCSSLMRPDIPYALVFDIGGGSTELIWVDNSGPRMKAAGMVSLPVGVVTLAEQTGAALASASGYADVVAQLAAQLQPFEESYSIAPLLAQGMVQMLGTSGTVTTLAALHMNLERYERSLVDGSDLNLCDVARVTDMLTGMSRDERAAHPCIGNDRADLVVAGCAILEAMCKMWPLNSLRVADRGVREGILLSMMRADGLGAATEQDG